jgi:hypothetical protein
MLKKKIKHFAITMGKQVVGILATKGMVAGKE